MLKLNLWTKTLPAIGISSLMVACAGNPKQADDDFKYLEAEPSASIVIPETLNPLPQNSDYQIDLEAPLAGNVGENVSIFPPRLIAPIVTASHIDEDDPRTSIWFEQTEYVDNLQQAIWDAVKGHLTNSNVEIEQFDESNQTLYSGWFTQQREFGWWLWSTELDLERQKYQFVLDMKPHGRSGKLTVSLVEREPLLEFYPDYDIADNQGLATEKLNAVAGQFDYKLRLDTETRRIQYVSGIVSQIGKAENGDDAIVIDADYEHAWVRVLEVLNHHNLILTDINKLQGRIYASSNEKEKGFWSGLFSADSERLGLDKGDYVIELLRNGAQTHLIFNDSELDALDKEKLDKLFPQLSSRLATDL